MTRIAEGRYEGQFADDQTVTLRMARRADGRLDNVSGDVFSASGHALSFVGNPDSLAEGIDDRINGVVSFYAEHALQRTGSKIGLAAAEGGDDSRVILTLNVGAGDVSAALSRVGPELRTLRIDIDGLASVATPDATLFEADPASQDLVSALKRASIAATVNVRPFMPDPKQRQQHSIAELHALMQDWNKPPEDIGQAWRIHVLFAGLFQGRDGSDVSGVMYDVEPGMRPARQGLAVFLNSSSIEKCLPVNSPEWRREVLFTLVHELGHALNLPHSFEDSRPQALTWMNYPAQWQTGEAAFWTSFKGMFDSPEAAFLNHAPFPDIAPGQNDYSVRRSSFLSGGGSTALRSRAASGSVDPSTVKAAVSIAPLKKTYVFGEPIFLKLSVTNNGRKPVSLAKAFDPSDGLTSIRIRKPSGKERTIRPPAALCQRSPKVDLGYRKTASFDGILASFDADGAIFDEPGRYRVEATFRGIDGIALTSPPSHLRVLHPTRAEELFAIAIWDDNALMRAIYCRQPLIALDAWRRLIEEQSRLLPEDDKSNTTMAYLRYIAALGWMSRFAPASRPKAFKPNRRKAIAFLRAVEEHDLPLGVSLRRRELLQEKS